MKIMPNYLLLCDCSSQFIIGTTDAGKTLQCADCGNSIVVPNLREIRELPTAEPTNVAKDLTWEKQNGLLFGVGIVLFTLCLLLALFEFYQASQLNLNDTTEEEISYGNAVIDQMPPMAAIQQWRLIQSIGLGDQREVEFLQNKALYETHQFYAMLECGVAAFGLVLCGIAFVMRKRTDANSSS